MLLPWYPILCAARGALVATPSRRRPGTRHALGLAVPAAAMIAGVSAIQIFSDGAQLLTWLAAIATPILAAAAGWSLRWQHPTLIAVAAAVLYLVAWQGDGHVAQGAGVVLIGAACLTLAAWLASYVAPDYLAVGLLLLIVVDGFLVFGTHQVAAAGTALQRTPLPSVSVLGLPRRELPTLQDVSLGSSSMGWLDFFAPAALGALLVSVSRIRTRTAVVVAACATAWGLLLLFTSPIPGTTPVLAGLALFCVEWACHTRS